MTFFTPQAKSLVLECSKGFDSKKKAVLRYYLERQYLDEFQKSFTSGSFGDPARNFVKEFRYMFDSNLWGLEFVFEPRRIVLYFNECISAFDTTVIEYEVFENAFYKILGLPEGQKFHIVGLFSKNRRLLSFKLLKDLFLTIFITHDVDLISGLVLPYGTDFTGTASDWRFAKDDLDSTRLQRFYSRLGAVSAPQLGTDTWALHRSDLK